MNLLLLIVITLAPSVALWFYLNKLDRDKEPKVVLIKLFFSGILASIMVILTSFFLELIFPGFIDYECSPSIKTFLYIFFGIAFVEEFFKFLAMNLFGWKEKNLNTTYDIILYCMIIALGFATFENILYAINGEFTTVISRAFTAVPGHVIDGSFMGYFFYRVKKAKNLKNKKKNLFLALLIPTITHSIYDYLVIASNSFLMIMLFIVYVIIEYIISLKLIKKLSRNSKNFTNKYNYYDKKKSNY